MKKIITILLLFASFTSYSQIKTIKIRGDSNLIKASVYYLVDSAIAASSTGGTVTNVATGLGLSGGPIITTGTLLVDTSSASILSRQRAAATYAPISITGTVTSVTASAPLSITSTPTLTPNVVADTTASTSTALVNQRQLGAKLDTSSAVKYNFTSIANGDLLKYEAANNRFINFTPQYGIIIDSPEHIYTSTVTWTATTRPSGDSSLSYRWTKIGSMVTLRINFRYTVAGAAITNASLPLPADCPLAVAPTGYASLDYVSAGSGGFKLLNNAIFSLSNRVAFRYHATAPSITVNAPSGAFIGFDLVVIYNAN